MSGEQQQMFEVYLQEYSKLKDEQAKRIGFRDNLLYVTLGLFGGVLSFALGEKANPYALVVLPWVCLVLGWTYLVNDEKISAIGKYIREELVKKISKQADSTNIKNIESIFGWEIAHRSDERRKRRKIEQLIVDEIAFVFSGIAGLVGFWFLVTQPHWTIQILCGVEFGLLIILGAEIFVYADLAQGRSAKVKFLKASN
jgi:hypothetical protein